MAKCKNKRRAFVALRDFSISRSLLRRHARNDPGLLLDPAISTRVEISRGRVVHGAATWCCISACPYGTKLHNEARRGLEITCFLSHRHCETCKRLRGSEILKMSTGTAGLVKYFSARYHPACHVSHDRRGRVTPQPVVFGVVA